MLERASDLTSFFDGFIHGSTETADVRKWVEANFTDDYVRKIDGMTFDYDAFVAQVAWLRKEVEWTIDDIAWFVRQGDKIQARAYFSVPQGGQMIPPRLEVEFGVKIKDGRVSGTFEIMRPIDAAPGQKVDHWHHPAVKGLAGAGDGKHHETWTDEKVMDFSTELISLNDQTVDAFMERWYEPTYIHRTMDQIADYNGVRARLSQMSSMQSELISVDWAVSDGNRLSTRLYMKTHGQLSEVMDEYVLAPNGKFASGCLFRRQCDKEEQIYRPS